MRDLAVRPVRGVLQPLERGLSGDDGAGKRRMSGLGRPPAGQPLPPLKPGVLCLWPHRILHLCDHVPDKKTWHPPGNHLTAPARYRSEGHGEAGCSHSRHMRPRAAAGLAGLRPAQRRPAAVAVNPHRRRTAIAVLRATAMTWADDPARSRCASSRIVVSRTWTPLPGHARHAARP